MEEICRHMSFEARLRNGNSQDRENTIRYWSVDVKLAMSVTVSSLVLTLSTNLPLLRPKFVSTSDESVIVYVRQLPPFSNHRDCQPAGYLNIYIPIKTKDVITLLSTKCKCKRLLEENAKVSKEFLLIDIRC